VENEVAGAFVPRLAGSRPLRWVPSLRDSRSYAGCTQRLRAGLHSFAAPRLGSRRPALLRIIPHVVWCDCSAISWLGV